MLQDGTQKEAERCVILGLYLTSSFSLSLPKSVKIPQCIFTLIQHYGPNHENYDLDSA